MFYDQMKCHNFVFHVGNFQINMNKCLEGFFVVDKWTNERGVNDYPYLTGDTSSIRTAGSSNILDLPGAKK